MKTAEEKQYETICSPKFKVLEEGIETIKEKTCEIHDRLFVDNSKESFQSFRNKTEAFMKLHLWIYSVLIIAVIGAVVALWFG